MTESEARVYIANLTVDEKWQLNELLKLLEKDAGPDVPKRPTMEGGESHD